MSTFQSGVPAIIVLRYIISTNGVNVDRKEIKFVNEANAALPRTKPESFFMFRSFNFPSVKKSEKLYVPLHGSPLQNSSSCGPLRHWNSLMNWKFLIATLFILALPSSTTLFQVFSEVFKYPKCAALMHNNDSRIERFLYFYSRLLNKQKVFYSLFEKQELFDLFHLHRFFIIFFRVHLPSAVTARYCRHHLKERHSRKTNPIAAHSVWAPVWYLICAWESECRQRPLYKPVGNGVYTGKKTLVYELETFLKRNRKVIQFLLKPLATLWGGASIHL